jgi:hypothetical protein
MDVLLKIYGPAVPAARKAKRLLPDRIQGGRTAALDFPFSFAAWMQAKRSPRNRESAPSILYDGRQKDISEIGDQAAQNRAEGS